MNLILPLHFPPRKKLTEGWDTCMAAMWALETRARSDAAIILQGEFIVGGQMSGLYFQGRITATTPEVIQPPSSEKHLHNVVASVRMSKHSDSHAFKTSAIPELEPRNHKSLSRDQRHSGGFCADKASWVFDLGHIYFGRYATTAQHQSSHWNPADDLGWFHLCDATSQKHRGEFGF